TRPERWQLWAAEVVGRLDDPDAVLDLIASRRADVDDDDQDADDVIAHIRACLGEQPSPASVDQAVVYIPTVLAAEWLRRLKPYLSTNQAVAELKGIQSPRLRFHRTKGGRYLVWVGELAPPDAQPIVVPYTPRRPP